MSDREDRPPWRLPGWDAVVPGTFGLRIYSVAEVARAIRAAVRADERLRELWVEGEVGRVTISSAGHAYFSLKDTDAQLACVWFRDDRLASAFEVRTGLRVVAHGRIDLYEPTGALQLYVDSVQPAGFGDLALRLEALKAKLAAEGLFDRARKRPLPERPLVVAVVTSPSGAVWHDIRTVLRRRWPVATAVLSPCLVQGDGAPTSIVAALDRVGRWIDALSAAGRRAEAPTVTIVARGGGSLEDLWAFNEEAVVRAIVGHPVPVVTGIGHETDVTLADFAADVRAPTPSAAAELVVPDRGEILGAVAGLARRRDQALAGRLVAARRALLEERRVLAGLDPRAVLASRRQAVDLLGERAQRAVARRLDGARRAVAEAGTGLGAVLPVRLQRAGEVVDRCRRLLPILVGRRLERGRAAVAAAGSALAALGPAATLERGFAIVTRAADGRIVRDPADAPAATALWVRVARGTFAATADGGAVATGPGSGDRR
jgi:exodeoxyribonuclease VII large subunit